MRTPARSALASLPIASVVLLYTLPGRADPSTADCLRANSEAIELRDAHKLQESRAHLVTCTAASCPTDVRAECLRLMDGVNAGIPTIAFATKDADGNDLATVKITVDDQPLLDHIAGTAIPLDPGEHRFRFEAAGLVTVNKTFVLTEGQKDRREVVVLGAAPASPRPPPPPAPTSTATVVAPGPQTSATPESQPSTVASGVTPGDTRSRRIGLAARVIDADSWIRHTDLLGAARPEPPKQQEASSTGQKIFGCTWDIASPTFLGWCSHGTVYAPLHAGWLGFFAANDGSVYAGAQAAAYLFAGGDFWGLGQGGALVDVGGDFSGLAQGGAAVVDGLDFRGVAQGAFLLADVGRDFYGLLQMSDIWASVGGRFGGLAQISPVAAIGGDFYGGAQAGAYSEVGGTFRGVAQAGAVARADGNFYGAAQGAFVFDYVGEDFGGVAQGAGAFNWVHGDFNGLLQMTFGYNRVDGTLRGAQLGLVNTATHVRGIQLGVFGLNWSEDLAGAQISLVNLAGHVRGVQIGAFNWTRHLEGLQIGLFNIPGEHGVPLPIANAGWN